jgi:hypothetical protein
VSAIQIPTERRTQAVPRSWMELLSNFAATWGRPDKAAWGLHCSRCKQDVIAQNDLRDTALSAKCGCQEYASDPFRVA